MDWERVRSDFLVTQNHIYLNTAGIGVTPQPVTAEMQRMLGLWSSLGPTSPPFREQAYPLAEAARAAAARLLGVSTTELAFTGRVAESLHLVVDGLRWHAGDEIVTSDEEVIYAPLLRVAQDHGVVIKTVRWPHNRKALLTRFADSLSPRTRLVWLSDITNKTGIHLPAREICDIAHDRGALVMFDGAQTAGQFPLNLKEIDCDFYAATGYKWLLGPYGCGVCYLREALLPELEPFRLGRGQVDAIAQTLTPDASAQRFEFGVRNVVLRIGFGRALAYIEEIGIEAIHERTMALRDHLRRGLAALPGLESVSPDDPSLASGITSLRVEGIEPGAVVKAAWQAHIVIVPIETATNRRELHGVRISPAFYNTFEEIDHLLEFLSGLTRGNQRGA